jgi:hypothetical protein
MLLCTTLVYVRTPPLFFLQRSTICLVNKGVSRLLLQNQGFLSKIRAAYVGCPLECVLGGGGVACSSQLGLVVGGVAIGVGALV